MTFSDACEIFKTRRIDQFANASEVIVAFAKHGLTIRHVITLTEAIASSGDRVDLPKDLGPFADVPSTGGPASLTTFLCPLLLAASGISVPKLSATGSIAGSIDSMGLLPGFRTQLKREDFLLALRQARIAHAEPGLTFCPADTALVTVRRNRNVMANPGLAAASLLGKKLAITGTAATFDFRVGRAGNIGDDERSANKTARLFERVADELGLHISIVLTDNSTFLCSALGRLESVDLLWAILNHGDQLSLDKDHIRTCITIAARAYLLTSKGQNAQQIEKHMLHLLLQGNVRSVFLRHLEAQGANAESIATILEMRQRHDRRIVVARQNGYWTPPDVCGAKKWLQGLRRSVQSSVPAAGAADVQQVGLRLLASPGEMVLEGQPVLEIRLPKGASPPNDWSFLAGKSTSKPMRVEQIMFAPPG